MSKYQWMAKEEHSTTYISNDSSDQLNTNIDTSTQQMVVPNCIKELKSISSITISREGINPLEI